MPALREIFVEVVGDGDVLGDVLLPAPAETLMKAWEAMEGKAFDEKKHPRGQPDNPGQFGPGGRSANEADDAEKSKTHDRVLLGIHLNPEGVIADLVETYGPGAKEALLEMRRKGVVRLIENGSSIAEWAAGSESGEHHHRPRPLDDFKRDSIALDSDRWFVKYEPGPKFEQALEELRSREEASAKSMLTVPDLSAFDGTFGEWPWTGMVTDGKETAEYREGKAWNEKDHPRGQPENAGQFGSGGSKHGQSSRAGTPNSRPSGGQWAAGSTLKKEGKKEPDATPQKKKVKKVIEDDPEAERIANELHAQHKARAEEIRKIADPLERLDKHQESYAQYEKELEERGIVGTETGWGFKKRKTETTPGTEGKSLHPEGVPFKNDTGPGWSMIKNGHRVPAKAPGASAPSQQQNAADLKPSATGTPMVAEEFLPAGGAPKQPEAKPDEPPKSEGDLLSAGDKTADGVLSKFKAAMDKATNEDPVLKHAVKPLLRFCTKIVARLTAGLEKRYGKRTARACLASGQLISWGSFLGFGTILPSSIMSLPAVALAEAYKQLRGGTIQGKSMDTEEVDLAVVEREGRALAESLQQAFERKLKVNKRRLEQILKTEKAPEKADVVPDNPV